MRGFPRRPRRLSTVVVAAVTLGLAGPVVLGTSAAEAATCPCSIFASTATPATPAEPDAAAVEVGVKFRSDVDGQVTALRFYKGTGNTGTHIGHLWDAAGTPLATATFASETATGWQQVNLSSPVSIAANTTYLASYYAPNGRYSADGGAFATAGIDNAPLHALRDGVDGGNGLYRYGTGGGFPTDTFQSTNYWVDVVFQPSGPDTTPPTVTSTSPVSGATGVATSANVTATFSEPVQSSTVQVQLTAAGGGAVAGSTSYDSASKTATFTPTSALSTSTGYTAAVSGAADASGNVMNPFSWSFTTGTASGSGCPCTIWPNTTTPGTASSSDSSSVELGVKFRSNVAGFVTGIRFYKGTANTGTHVGTLWSGTGTKLSSATFSGESGSGWQTVNLPSPVAITANTTYVASYFAPVGRYAVTNNGFASAVTRGPLTALANSTSANGVYRYGGGGVFPTNTFQASNYWVDVVFDTSAADTTPPTVTGRTPAPNATGVATTTSVTATFSEQVSPASIAFTLTGPGGAVPAGVGYDSASMTATLSPTSALAANTTYTASVSGAQDAAGNTMAPVSWSFTTGGTSPPPLDSGPGGPVLVVKNPSSSDSQFTPFTAEVLRAEGLNEFTTTSLSTVTAATLANFDVVILGRTPLTAAQISMFSTWVNGGGNLIAFRPAAGLASLLGLTSAAGTQADKYLQVDTTQAPGAGITPQVIQYHGTADNYTLAGARAVATLFSSATASTPNPAVTIRSVGTNGGEAAAFTFDLAQSLVYTRQGNPAWEGQERDGVSPVRSDDMYFGGTAAPDYVDLNKVAIPQADEQQRLLANLVEQMNANRKPLPRFWYFPRSLKAVVVSTGDDHANGGTATRFNEYASLSPAGCSVTNWDCLRKTSYVYPNAPLTNAQASSFTSQGFEVGLHPQNNCTDYTAASLETAYATQLAQWAQKYSGIPVPTTNRFHCMPETDYAGQPTTELAHGIRFDTNYYYWPGDPTLYPDWLKNRPGFMTGSGMPMRFSTKAGGLLDVYQATTQMTDESGQSYPFTPDTLLDNALGSLGYYGAFTVNLHTDNGTTPEDDALLSSATSRGVPMVTSKQMLTWLDARNSSSFSAISATGNTLAFTVNAAGGATGLTGMVPTAGSGGSSLSTLTRNGTAVAFTRTTIKGIEYAFFPAAAGSYVATYQAAAPLAQVAAVGADVATSDTVAVRWSTDKAATSQVVYGTSPASLTGRVTEGDRATKHEVELAGLAKGTRYYYRVVSTDQRGRQTVSPPPAAAPASFTVGVPDRTAPAVSAPAVAALPGGTATMSWRTNEPADSSVAYGTSAARLDQSAVDGGPAADHGVQLVDLRPGTRYYYRVVSADAVGNRSASAVRTFVTPANGVADDSLVAFRLGSGSGTAAQQTASGELALAPAGGSEFLQPQLPDSMSASAVAAGGSWQVMAGELRTDGARVQLRQAGGNSLSFAATFDPQSAQSVGWGSGSAGPSAVIATRSGGLAAVTTAADGRVTVQALPAGLAGAGHQFAIDRSGSTVTFRADGAVVARHQLAAGALTATVEDSRADGIQLAVDWIRLAPAVGSGTFTSRILDAQQMVTWRSATLQADRPAGTAVTLRVRTGSTATPDATWTGWRTVPASGAVGGNSRYLQYQLTLTGSAGATPVVSSVGFSNSGTPVREPGEARPK